MTASNQELFDRWFAAPLKLLHEKLPNNDGGFVALAMGLFLYERYYRALRTVEPPRTDEQDIARQLAKEFGLQETAARNFWEIARNGLLHQGMLKQKNYGKANLPSYEMGADLPLLEFSEDPYPVFRFNPFKFTYRVLDLWKPHLDLFDLNTSFPVPFIYQTGDTFITRSVQAVATKVEIPDSAT